MFCSVLTVMWMSSNWAVCSVSRTKGACSIFTFLWDMLLSFLQTLSAPPVWGRGRTRRLSLAPPLVSSQPQPMVTEYDGTVPWRRRRKASACWSGPIRQGEASEAVPDWLRRGGCCARPRRVRLGGEEETVCSQVRRQEGSQVGAQFLLLTASDVSDGQARLKNRQTNEMKTGISVFADSFRQEIWKCVYSFDYWENKWFD